MKIRGPLALELGGLGARETLGGVAGGQALAEVQEQLVGADLGRQDLLQPLVEAELGVDESVTIVDALERTASREHLDQHVAKTGEIGLRRAARPADNLRGRVDR